ncbi:MAG TPA: 50S ribosomal protein L29 [Thermodesulfobacteriota bacterium]|nr:50S ribosomal protein L29 [Deltaproteobacteria bacterium]HNR14043.1 50S ribosomal protein L29 [Thermodesulfobacteriota bacterium]HNU70641.1 50S ribosomal protein L29 [Thermodesulfobacteriota bacterium]HQO77038.1 50S ribosomal protein L29 [Thermodesulfobacteriota bacterium]
MKAREVRELSHDEVIQKEKDLTEELFNLRFQHALGQLENTMRITHVRKDLARVKTIMREQKKA